MEPHGSSGNTAEAERWLLIAEKLLAGRDLVGSKTFALRAREAIGARDPDPTLLEAADLILAVADTLINGEKRINGRHPDWYAILNLPRDADGTVLSAHYRHLALLLNPQRNRFPFAEEAMNLARDAWSVLCNPETKALYDNEIISLSNPEIQALREESNHNHEHEQPRPQDAAAVRKSPKKSSDSKSKDRNVAGESETPTENHDLNSTFWTACPYCYNMYEYPGVYADCSLRCQNCRRAFHGTKIMAPPPIIQGKENYYCCWGFYPLAVMEASKPDKNMGGAPSWTPFAPMFTGPQFGDGRNGGEDNVNNIAAQTNVNAGKSSAPRIYVDDEDVYVDVSESSEGSDDDWGGSRQKKKAKNAKGKDSTGKNVKTPVREKAKYFKGGSGDGLQSGTVMQEVFGVPNVSSADTSKKVAASNAKKQTGKFAKQWGRLDLNVEFSNEVEEPAPGMSRVNVPGMSRGPTTGMGRVNAPGMGRGIGAGNGEEDGIEGIGFFEGLDEFLSNLPILKS